MKKPSKKIFIVPAVFVLSIAVILIIIDAIILPLYVSSDEYTVPKVIGMNKDEAIKVLKDLNLSPIVTTSRYDEKFGKDEVIFQKPAPDAKVKEGRRIYLTISGGEQMVAVPNLINKTLRDAQITLERMGLSIGKIDSVESEFPAGVICDQQFLEGREIYKGSYVDIAVSLGPQTGMIRVPGILGRTLNEAEKILKSNSLYIGLKTYITSSTMLPNTVVDQQPSEGSLVPLNDSINVVLTQSE
jgi:serine/threonine-protein kinase